MTFPVEIWVRGNNDATTELMAPVARAPEAWTDQDVAVILAEMLRALDRAKDPTVAADRPIALRGFSWIVNPWEEGGVVIAMELSIGAVVAGPFNLPGDALTKQIERVIATDRRMAEATGLDTVH